MDSPAPESVRSGANLQPQATKLVQNTSFPSLVNSHATFISPEDLLISNPTSRDPTLEQAQAIATLQNYHSSDIIAWHTLSQSVESAWRHQDGPGGLSIQETRAISTLSSCSREELIQWLESANQKAPSKVGLSDHRCAAAASSHKTQQPSPRFDHASARLSVVKSVKAISPHLSNNPYSALIAVHDSLTPGQTVLGATSHKISALARPPNPNHTYWCTVGCDRSYKRRDDWKKHEKEHEIKYICMRNGLFEPTEDGQKCVLCGAVDPADSHHSAHNIGPCLAAADRPSFKRRYDMVTHLKAAHDISSGGIIADKWRCKSSKIAWSCGFCIQLFPSLKDRLEHIGTEHFEKGKSINDWDFTKVIQGLLLQPEIQEAWQHLLDTVDPFRLSEIKWNRFGNKDLQGRLENGLTGRVTAQSLSKAAYDNAEYDWSLADIDNTTFATATDSLPDQYINNSSSLFPQNHAVASEGAPVKCQPWSPPQHQASQIPTSSPTFKIQSAYITPASNSPPVHHIPSLDYDPMWKPLASGTTDMNTTSNDKFSQASPSTYIPWVGDNITPGPTHSDQETFHYVSNDETARSMIPHPHLDIESSALKRPRESVSPPAQTLAYKSSLKDRPRKKRCRKMFREHKTASRNMGVDDRHGGTCDEEEARSELAANRCLRMVFTHSCSWP